MLWFEHDLYDQLQLIQVLDGLAALRSPVVRRHFQEAQAAWAAFRSSNPLEIDPHKPKALQFLGAALRRHLEEFPWTTDGLSRTERQILAGNTQEEPAFLSHVVLEWHVQRLENKQRFPRWLGGCEVRDEALRWDPALSRLVSA